MASETSSPPAKVQKLDPEPAEEKPATRRCPRCKQNTLARKGGNLDTEVPDIYNQLIPAPSPALTPHPLFNHCKPPVPPRYNKFSLFVAGSLVWLLIAYVSGYNLVLFLYNAIRQRSPLLADILYGLWQTIRLVFRLARSMAGHHHSGT